MPAYEKAEPRHEKHAQAVEDLLETERGIDRERLTPTAAWTPCGSACAAATAPRHCANAPRGRRAGRSRSPHNRGYPGHEVAIAAALGEAADARPSSTSARHCER